MDRLEADLREEFAGRVATAPGLPALADTVMRRGRRARLRNRAVAATGLAAVAAVAVAAGSLLPSLSDRAPNVAASLQGPPRVPLYVAPGSGEIIDWVGGEQRTRAVGESAQPVAQVPSGLLLVVLDAGQPALALLSADEAEPSILVRGLHGEAVAVAVSDDGQRATVVIRSQAMPQLQEVELPSGRVLRSVGLGMPVFDPDRPLLPVAYSADAVLLTAGEGPAQFAALWEGGDDAVVAPLDGFDAAVGGGDAKFSSGRDAVGGRGAFRVGDARCRTEVHELRNGDGRPWKLCRETFVGFSPSGDAVLATDATGNALVVHDAANGDVDRTFQAPNGLRAYGWESDDTVLYSTVAGSRTLVVRCSVTTGTCMTAAEFPYTDRIAQPVRLAG
jgi:hypothetical protein